MGKRPSKFRLLMWKNWKLARRAKWRTIFEILVPVFIMFILVFLRRKVTQKGEIRFKAVSPEKGFFTSFEHIAYSPTNKWIDEIMEKFVANHIAFEKVPLSSSQELEKYLYINSSRKVGIQFDDAIANTDNVPTNLEITIRLSSKDGEWYTRSLYPPIGMAGPRNYQMDDDVVPLYLGRGFLAIQQALTYYLLGDSNTDKIPEVSIQRYPYPSWNDDSFFIQMQKVLPMFVIVSFMLPYINTVRSVTTEKEKQLKESMKIMGLSGWLHWTAWFCRTFVILIIIIVLVLIILKANFGSLPMLPYSDGFLLFILFALYGCATITLSFLVSVFFSKANIAVAFGAIIWLLTCVPFLAMDYDTTTAGAKVSVSIFSNTAMCNALRLTLNYEGFQVGIQWNNIFKSVSHEDDLKLGYLLLMLILDAFLYLILALYAEAIFPGEFGVPLPWYFPFTKDFWTASKQDMSVEDGSQNQGEFFERSPGNLPKGIQIKNLCKSFGSHEAVNNLSLDLYEGQITVLLGHNGAGKTTTMCMLTGMFPPTKGTALIAGYDVRTNPHKVRDSMGLCLQHDVLFDSLTVKEHLLFFGKLKGLKKKEIKQEIDRYITILELEDKKNARISSLSGGMKRKVCVAVALCGKSKVIMLDEPTAGLDPSARRTVWDLLQKEKQGRTILLTTHFMDEADLLGDRIAIMAAGKLQCCGSGFFLKKKYGAGYFLVIDKTPKCNPDKITNLLKMHLPKVDIQSNVGSELTYLLPEDQSPKFEKMLQELEHNMSLLEIRSYGVSLATIEDVFMKVGADHTNEAARKNETNAQSNVPLLSGCDLVKNQVLAMTMKKFLSTWRSWILFLLQVIIPVILLIVVAVGSSDDDSRALPLTLDKYQGPVSTLEGDSNTDLYKTYKVSIEGSGHELKAVPNVETFILDYISKNPSDFRMKYIVGASLSESTAKAWYSGEPYHAQPLSLALVLNTVYKKIKGQGYSISFTNHPIPNNKDSETNNMMGNPNGYKYSFLIGIGMIFAASLFIIFYIRERVCKSKHSQLVSGTSAFIFWSISYICDILIFFVTIIAIIITMAIIQEDGFKTGEQLGILTLILLCFVLSVLPLIYLASYMFSVPSTGFSSVLFFGLFVGIIGFVLVEIILVLLGFIPTAAQLDSILIFVPFYWLIRCVFDMSTVYDNKKACQVLLDNGHTMKLACAEKEECCHEISYLSSARPGLMGSIVISLFVALLLFLILVANEYGMCSCLCGRIITRKKRPVRTLDLDEDVNKENVKIKNTPVTSLTTEYTLVLKDVTKYYRKVLAVNGLCLGVKKGECFGLLGVNGAGKTTTFRLLTGDERFSYGKAWLNGISIRKQQKKARKFMGYCPQFDAFLDDLTVKETLTMYALIRGVPRNQCKSTVKRLAEDFDFSKYLNKKVGHLSGGNKRKICTSLALIGDPPVIFLDEPTTGMDPATKRYLWNALCKLRDNGKCIILTSHSMEECEAMCTRLAIMVNGGFQCLGSGQRLKSKFAQGFTLAIKMNRKSENLDADIDSRAIEHFVKSQFPGAILKEKYRELLTFQLPSTSMPLSEMFGILERNKKKLDIEDYSLTQCSLEQVFLSFTKHQQ